MNCPKPHFLLFCDGNYPSNEHTTTVTAGAKCAAMNSRWRFVLEDIESGTKFEASDRENGAAPDRMALVAVLRGLEALEQPSRVTLVTTSRYVFRGLQYGLTEWRENDYSWEHFGSVQPIRNADLWKRIDRTLAFHQVQCRLMSNDQVEKPTTAMDLAPTVEDQMATSSASTNDSTFDASSEHNEHSSTVAPISKKERETVPSASVTPTVSVARPKAIRVTSSTGAKYRVDPQSNTPSRSETTTPTIACSPKEPAAIFKDSCQSGCDTSNRSVCGGNESAETSSNRQAAGFVKGSICISTADTSSFGPSTETGTKSKQSIPAIRTLMNPFLWVVATIASGLGWAWSTLLRIDEGIESYLRCLFLMDPANRRRR